MSVSSPSCHMPIDVLPRQQELLFSIQSRTWWPVVNSFLQSIPCKMSGDEVQYLVQHGIPQLVNDMVADLVKDKPTQPINYMADWFSVMKNMV